MAEVLPLVGGFARRYNRVLELGLDDLQLPDLVDHVRQLSEIWQRQAVLQYILTSYLAEALLDENCWSTMVEFSSLIEPSVETVRDLIQELAHLGPDGRIKPQHTAFLLGLCRRLETTSLLAVIAWLVTEFGPADWLQSEDFEASFVKALNRAAPAEAGAMDEATVTEFCLLALQNGPKTIELLMQAAVRNAGQIPAVVSLLQHPLESVCLHSDGQRSTLGHQLVEQFESRKEKELDNVIEIYLALAKREKAHAALEVFCVLPRILFECWSRRAYSDSLVYANVLVKSLTDTPVLDSGSLQQQNLLTTVIVLLQIVNSTALLSEPVADLLALREVSLGGLHRLLSARRPEVEPVLQQLLIPTFRPYFFPAPVSLLAAIQSVHFIKKPYIVKGLIDQWEESSLVLILPQIMRCEWQHLFEVGNWNFFLSTQVPVTDLF